MQKNIFNNTNRWCSVAFIVILLFCCQQLSAQPPNRGRRVEAARAAFITEKLELTPEQAQKFWPIYNELETKRKALRQNNRLDREENLEQLTESQARDEIVRMFDNRQKELELERSYLDKFLSVISARQLAYLYKSEREFNKMLIKRLEGGNRTPK